MSTHDHDPARDAAFDAAVRQAHAASLEHVSPRVRAQLQQRRRAALAGQAHDAPRTRLAAWPIAAAAALGALAIGLSVRAPTPSPAVAPAPVVADASTPYDTLDENPDLYVWLASDDAATLAME